MCSQKNLTIQQIEEYLREVDALFPVPLSQKKDLADYAVKLHEEATICAEVINGKIVACVAGYTDNVTENRGYMSIAATVPNCQGKGYMTKLFKQFLAIADEKSLDAVHFYVVPTNTRAIALYKRIGFEEWKFPGEPRPKDMHMIYYLKKDFAKEDIK